MSRAMQLLERAMASDLGTKVTIDFDSMGLVCMISDSLARIAP